jgi:VIT1/CCC1 family predicted Fe2+/Mn2+ transporter
LIFKPEAILSLIATAFAVVMFLLMLQESIALGKGRDPVSNTVRAVIRRFPRATYAVAVVIGMLLGHLFWA